ncbi:MAG: hypothetical protein ABIW82_03950 [Dokdonella sp.]
MKRLTHRVMIACALLLAAAMNLQAAPQTTAFTYQGQLSAGGTLPSGQTYQFTFTLYDAASAGNVVGTPIQQALLVGNGGLFTSDLDFGQIFNGQQYWLEIKVGTTVPNEQALAARQLIGTTPVAQYALNSRTRDFADFFAMMPPDNAGTVAVGTDVQFPQNGPSSGSIVRVSPSQFSLPSIGAYQVMFQVSVSEPAQLVMTLNGVELPTTVAGRSAGSSQVVGLAVVQNTQANSILSIRNPLGGVVALTISPLAGGTSPVSAHLVITRMD